MGQKSPRLRALASEFAHRYPHLEDPDALIAAGEVLVNGFPRTNPASLVDAGDSITVRRSTPLRGESKLTHALQLFDVSAAGRVAVDLGAAAGGFTRVLLDAGARRVYAVDAGHGQLLGSLRQDPRVVNLERTNLAALDGTRIPETVGVITMDLSYLSIAGAVPQLHHLDIEAEADLVALVKPTYELGLPRPPADELLESAVTHAADGLSAAGWRVVANERSPVRGSRGTIEYLVHARRTIRGEPPQARRAHL